MARLQLLGHPVRTLDLHLDALSGIHCSAGMLGNFYKMNAKLTRFEIHVVYSVLGRKVNREQALL